MQADWRVSVAPIPSRLATRKVCPHSPQHWIARRVIDEDLLICFGVSCNLEALDMKTGKRLFKVPFQEGFRWAIGYHAERICRWRAGRRTLIYNPYSNRMRTTRWAMPAEVDAVGIGQDMLAIRQGMRTTIVNYDGELVNEARLPLWEHGVFADGSLILTREKSNQDGPEGVWIVYPTTGHVLWSSVKDRGSWVVR